MALLQPPTQNAAQFTLDSQLGAGGATATLNQDVSSIAQAPGLIVIDRVDSSGNETPTKREYMTFTGVSTADLTGLTRGLAGSSDQVHAVGAIVEFVPDVVQQQAIYDAIVAEHSTTGAHVSLTSLSAVKAINYNGSGASLVGMTPIRPFWFVPSANLSAATTGLGSPIDMPSSGTIEYVSVTLNGPISGASLAIDINKNFSSLFEAATRPGILGGGTFVSTASLNTNTFDRADILSVDVDTAGLLPNTTIRLEAR